jgi:predicted transcriptional regulator of viral defense system
VKRRLGHLERQLLAYAQMRGVRTLKTGDLVAPLGITPKQERELFTRMAGKGLIAKVRRGLYLVPERLPLGARWTPHEALVLNTMLTGDGARYQVCGPNAFNRYGFSDQVPAQVWVYNNRVSERRTVGAVALRLIKVGDERLGEVEEEETPEGTLVYASRVRTLVDAVYDWSRFNSLPRGYGWIRTDLEEGRVTPEELVRMSLLYGNLSTMRRIGAVLEEEGGSDEQLKRLHRAVGRPTSTLPLVPRRPLQGDVNRRWGVVLNG